MIEVESLTKEYRVHKRAPGLRAAFASLFHRSYERVVAVDGISFQIDRAERVGFLGPNGAGKTTTLKILAGLLHPTTGHVRVDGFEPQKRQDAFLKRIMLVLGQKQQLIWDLPPAETFELNRAIYEVSRSDYQRTLSELVDLLGIGDIMKKPTRQLSLGERMKCELVATLIHRPKVLFLDEPTIGLDVSMQVAIRTFIKRYNEDHGASLILTSHYMDDVAALCPRVIVIDKGRISFDGALQDLADKIRPDKRVVLRLEKPADLRDLEQLGQVIENSPGQAVIQVSKSAVNDTVSRALAGLAVLDLTVENPPLEEIMSEFFSRSRSERPPPMP